MRGGNDGNKAWFGWEGILKLTQGLLILLIFFFSFNIPKSFMVILWKLKLSPNYKKIIFILCWWFSEPLGSSLCNNSWGETRSSLLAFAVSVSPAWCRFKIWSPTTWNELNHKYLHSYDKYNTLFNNIIVSINIDLSWLTDLELLFPEILRYLW